MFAQFSWNFSLEDSRVEAVQERMRRTTASAQAVSPSEAQQRSGTGADAWEDDLKTDAASTGKTAGRR
eukprot:scaffold78127_cov69-Phaeocystis_antarctica.AAC.2